jgi:hypothetical protein
MIVTKAAIPTWEPLLKEDDDYVEGGKPFERSGIGKGAMSIPPQRDFLPIDLHHEEFVNVRKAEVPLGISYTEAVPVSLSTRITPAQGNATVQVVPDDDHILGKRRVFVRWDRMENTNLTPEQYVMSLPRVCPPVTFRHSNTSVWRDNVGWRIQRFIDGEKLSADNLGKIRGALQQQDQLQYAVNSDGQCVLHQEILDKFLDLCVEALFRKRNSQELESQLWRIVAHCFANRAEIEKHLHQEIENLDTDMLHHQLLAAGRCIRSSETCKLFIDTFCRRMRKPNGVNNWMRAFSELVKYRPDALSMVLSDVCYSLLIPLFRIFNVELDKCLREGGDASQKQLIKFSFVGMVFLLRRRIYDQEFLPPDSELAVAIKNVAQKAQAEAQQGRLVFSANSHVDMYQSLQQLIDYIDKRGHGSIAMAED